ncbi:MAG: hypothetical protein JSU04_17010 [Bdellovibrionales bacterium]|nr:hypothetical protein [Bdellovibrionales bacterium]
MHLRTQLRTHWALSLIGAIAALNLAGCSQDKPTTPSGKFWGIFSPAAATGINIVGEDLQPLAGAQILIGMEEGAPFAGNYMTADAAGHIDLPAGWTDAQAVTIEAPGHVRATYFAQTPGDRTYRLRKRSNTNTTQFEVKGTTTGHNIQDRDGIIDFGLVIPAMTRNDFLAFNIDAVISPQSDVITILGQDAEVPSNITFPKQKESYILPVTIDKPNYRTYFAEGGVQKVFAARGRFPFKQVVDKLRNKAPMYELVNDFTISGGGLKDLNITKSSTQMDLSVTDMDFKGKVNVTAPAIAGDETMMAVGVAHFNEYMVPTDVKVVKSGQKQSLSTLDNKGSVLSVLKKSKDLDSSGPGTDRLSAVLVPAGNGVAPQFLPIMADPSMAANGDLLLQKMNSIFGVNAIATYAVVSQVLQSAQGAAKVQVNSSYWEMYAPQWAETLSLPKWPGGNHLPGKKHWEVNFLGSLNVSTVDLGPAMINNATHVTHSSLDF